ncbi:TlpA family protein disulfide reductase [Shewanella sp. WXL01]|uniref:TlpA family protein disulfide reductase n=1 Tax=Shewanella sp. WXL01 TaxID=2709721 RepID=UPI00143855AD|nr:TlpA disulfide reductase family protein [Shewanella sp. WXL01]NKF51918.1 TlpA family protein disulfide reductase [Shewanella sp. WXL01]
MNKLTTLLASVLLTATCTVSFASQASLPSEKVYDTGENIPKPMIMSRFIEMTKARKVNEVPLTSLDGETVKLSDYRGKLVVMNLWATWCAPCIKEIPMMEKIRQDNINNDLVVMPVSIDEEYDKVAAFLTRHKLDGYPTLIDPQAQIENMVPLNVVPATYVFDGEGNLVGFLRGYLDWGDKEVQPYLEQLTAKYANPTTFSNAQSRGASAE